MLRRIAKHRRNKSFVSAKDYVWQVPVALEKTFRDRSLGGEEEGFTEISGEI